MDIDIPIRDIEGLAQAYAGLLDGKRRNKQQPQVQEPYEFGEKVRWNVTKNLKLLRRALKTLEEFRRDTVKRLKGDSEKELNDKGMEPQLAKFKLEWGKHLDEIEKITGLLPIAYSALRVDENGLESTLETIHRYDLITDDSDAADADKK